jgi:hypothetical protein
LLVSDEALSSGRADFLFSWHRHCLPKRLKPLKFRITSRPLNIDPIPMKKSLLCLLTGTCLTLSSHAVVLSAWTFETNTPTDLNDSALGPAVVAESGVSYDVLQNSNVGTNAFSFGTWNGTTAITNYSYSVDLSGIAALDNQVTLSFRFVLTSNTNPSGGTVVATGTSRMDNMVINAVPEPAMAFLGSLGLLGLLRRRRN